MTTWRAKSLSDIADLFETNAQHARKMAEQERLQKVKQNWLGQSISWQQGADILRKTTIDQPVVNAPPTIS